MFEVEQNTELLVCVKCRRGTEALEGETRPGQLLFDRLSNVGIPDGVTVRAVECLSNCSQGCSVALRGGAAKWTYIYGNLHEVDHVLTLTEGALAYHATADGLVPWRERPEHFRKNCIARIPPMES